MDNEQIRFLCIRSLQLRGYRPFQNFAISLSELEVIVGTNGSGKSSLFEFLKFLRDAIQQEIPPEIVTGSIGQQIFHRPGPDRFWWKVEVNLWHPKTFYYEGEILGPIGQTRVIKERVDASNYKSNQLAAPHNFLDFQNGKGIIQDPESHDPWMLDLGKPNQLGLGVMTNPSSATLHRLRNFIINWRFYSSFNINSVQIRRSVPVEQEPLLREDGSNLSAVLFYLFTEHPLIFDELKFHLRMAVPGFRNLLVKARGGPGEVIAFWQEEGVETDLTLADLSDGVLRFLCWATLCLMPNPPTLICVDEPDQGVHPRTLPILAGLFEKASTRTQLLLATHASYFLTQFDIPRIAVMKKVNGESCYFKPSDSATLIANLEDFGIAELEAMHRSDELEILM